MAEVSECSPLVVTMMGDDTEKDEPLTALPIYKEEVEKDSFTRENQLVTTNDAEKTEGN